MVVPSVKLRKGDLVEVIRGDDRGKRGKIIAVFRETQRLVVEKLNLVKRHVRPRRQGEKGGRVEVAASLPFAAVMLVCSSCKRRTRVRLQRSEGRRVRICRHCQAAIE